MNARRIYDAPKPDDMMVTMTAGQLKDMLEAVMAEGLKPLQAKIHDLECIIDREAYQDEVLMGEKEIAQYLGLGVTTLSRLIKNGTLDGIVRKIGGQYRAKRSALDRADTKAMAI